MSFEVIDQPGQGGNRHVHEANQPANPFKNISGHIGARIVVAREFLTQKLVRIDRLLSREAFEASRQLCKLSAKRKKAKKATLAYFSFQVGIRNALRFTVRDIALLGDVFDP